MGKFDNPQLAHWYDSLSVGRSMFERLHFGADYEWTELKIWLENPSDQTAPATLEVMVNGVSQTPKNEKHFQLKSQEKICRVYQINKRCVIDIEGYLSGGVLERALDITAQAFWKADKPPLQSKSVTDRFTTSGSCLVYGIWLPDSHRWDSCRVLVEGAKMKSCECFLTLLQDGALNGDIHKIHLSGTESQTLTYTDINARVPLIVAGSLHNRQIGSAADVEITLTGYYQEES